MLIYKFGLYKNRHIVEFIADSEESFKQYIDKNYINTQLKIYGKYKKDKSGNYIQDKKGNGLKYIKYIDLTDSNKHDIIPSFNETIGFYMRCLKTKQRYIFLDINFTTLGIKLTEREILIQNKFIKRIRNSKLEEIVQDMNAPN